MLTTVHFRNSETSDLTRVSMVPNIINNQTNLIRVLIVIQFLWLVSCSKQNKFDLQLVTSVDEHARIITELEIQLSIIAK